MNTGSLNAKQIALKSGRREKKVSFPICHIHLLIPNENKNLWRYTADWVCNLIHTYYLKGEWIHLCVTKKLF